MTHHTMAVGGFRDKVDAAVRLVAGQRPTIVFTRTREGAVELAEALTAAGVEAVDLHGNLSQRVRERNLHKFSSGKAQAVVATDVAARGIHVDNVDLVIHFDAASDAKSYLHRRAVRRAPARTAASSPSPRRSSSTRSCACSAAPGSRCCTTTCAPPRACSPPRRWPRPAARRRRAPRVARRPQGGRSFSGGPRKTYGGQGGGARRPEGRPDSRGEGARRGGRPGGSSRWSDNGR